ncbi:MAG: hypothetical protein U0802_12675 [Candidatus Binatia bacterium]
MSAPTPPPRRAARVLKQALKIVFFPFLFMVNPKIYFTGDEEEADDRASKG